MADRWATLPGEAAPHRSDVMSSRSLPGWAPLPTALGRLRARGWCLAVLSNSDSDLLAASLEQIGVTVELTVVAADLATGR